MADFIPALNSSGTFNFKKPISDKVNPQTSFICKSVRKISELIANGIDVYKIHYVANALSLSTYEEDRKNDCSIIGLYSEANNWIYVPSSQINAYPDASGVAYRRMALTINLGPIVESYDLNSLHESLSELIFTHLGIRPVIKAVSLSEKAMVKYSEHEAIQKMRLGKVDINKTIYVELNELRNKAATLAAKNKILEEHILRIINQ